MPTAVMCIGLYQGDSFHPLETTVFHVSAEC